MPPLWPAPQREALRQAFKVWADLGLGVRFREVSSREQCDALRGRTLTAPPLDDADGYWVHELVGATVVTADGVERGVVESVQANPANDLLVLDGGALVPVTFIVDGPADGRVTVEVPDGLFELYT